ncbi:MAG: hypothetical protein O2909_09820 [Chloroflexi bacterium]|nr:hypothetical protein [Chloroflexota bacterium]MDA1219725.1 hypothetical protein [Chloroflexota bacterium]PKB57367.1 MAG: hypothetical protein BZY73_03635 [SAR202 cluster bacterium Casp-Chloro-G3]
MRLKIGLLPPLAAAIILALVVACGSAAPPASNPNPANQPPTTTPIPPEARQAAQDFARAQRLIEEDWERFHTEFDQWRVGLSSCDWTAAQATLRGFAGDLSEITQQANNLPRSSSTRRLADQLIESAEKEAAGLRRLSDRWQPDATALFEAVDSARAEGLASQKAVADDLADLSESTGQDALDDARKFSTEFASVKKDWASLHDAYNSVRDEQVSLRAADSATKLGEVIDDLKKVQSAVDDLPSSDTSKSMIADLKKAAKAEQDALTQLKESFDSQAEGDSAPSFSDTDAKASGSDGVLEQVDDDLKDILEASSSDKSDIIGDVDAFRQQYDLLVQDWAAFHDEYNEWRRTEGGCNRVEVSNRLGAFALRFGDISKRVNNLPQASFLRPMGDSLVDAAQREEEALRILRNTWRPFATDAYRALDQERDNARRLRRQAGVGVQELMQRFGMSPDEL